MASQRRDWACLLVLGSLLLVSGLGNSVSAAFPVSKNPVRISSEKPADYGEDEKEIALLTLREWGLGSFRLFAELAGACRAACHADMSGIDEALRAAAAQNKAHQWSWSSFGVQKLSIGHCGTKCTSEGYMDMVDLR